MFQITITEIAQSHPGELFAGAIDTMKAHLVAEPIEHARIQVATLDVHALVSLIYAKPRKPRAPRSDAGKPRAGK